MREGYNWKSRSALLRMMPIVSFEELGIVVHLLKREVKKT